MLTARPSPGLPPAPCPLPRHSGFALALPISRDAESVNPYLQGDTFAPSGGGSDYSPGRGHTSRSLANCGTVLIAHRQAAYRYGANGVASTASAIRMG